MLADSYHVEYSGYRTFPSSPKVQLDSAMVESEAGHY